MPISMFVKKSDKVKIEVFVFEKDGKIEAITNKNELPTGVDAEAVEFHFRQPTFSDSNNFLKQFRVNQEDVNVGDLQVLVMSTMLVDWTIKDENGKKAPVSKQTIDTLHPVIARAAVTDYLSQIQF